MIYKTDKKPDEPCSITSSLAYFPDEEGSDQNVTGPPRIPPSNLTVVTVEGCPSFVILDWQKSDNETRGTVVVPGYGLHQGDWQFIHDSMLYRCCTETALLQAMLDKELYVGE